jgi:hypothetical protein
MLKLLASFSLILFLGISGGCLGNSELKNMTGLNQDEAKITITTIVYPGSTNYRVEFDDGHLTVDSIIKYYFNPVTQEGSFQGDLSPIYQAITNQPLDDPSILQSPDSILSILSDHGWAVVEDKTIEEPQDSSGPSEVRTVIIRRMN